MRVLKRSEHAWQPFTRRLIQVAVASYFATTAHANPTGPSVLNDAAAQVQAFPPADNALITATGRNTLMGNDAARPAH